MKTALAAFHAGIDQLVAFLERTEREQELVGLLNERRATLPAEEATRLQKLVETSTQTKQYIYAVATISAYGLLERLVDSLIDKYVMRLAAFGKPFDQLPEVIRNNHLQKSLLLADAMMRETFRAEVTHAELIANLHSCFSGDAQYTVNGMAFSFHRGNVSLAKITEMLSGVGVMPHLRRISQSPIFIRFSEERDPERNIRVINDEDLRSLFEPIDELVERRNGISHGVLQADEIQSVGILKERCEFVRAYGGGLYEALTQNALKYAAEIGAAHALGVPIAVYNNRIVCFEATCGIAIGDHLFVVTDDEAEPVRFSDVISLEVEHVDRAAIEAGEPVRFGAQVTFHANEGYSYFLLRASRL